MEDQNVINEEVTEQVAANEAEVAEVAEAEQTAEVAEVAEAEQTAEVENTEVSADDYYELSGLTPGQKKRREIFDKITTGILILLMCSPVLILLYIFLWFIFR